jgi:putative membrane-bound dehydrogenase-like protein
MPCPILAILLAVQDPQVPEGFTIRKVAESSFPMFATFDNRGRLYVTESSGGDLYLELQKSIRGCRIRRFEDKDGDGVFETSTVFAEGLVPSMGIVWHGGKLYAADPPDLVAYEDFDDDGKADRRRVILTGFGHSDNGSLHGLLVGPDGLLYMTTGEPDGYAIRRRDGTTLSGRSGALIRCKPDGSDPEVLARGFENLIEIVFLPGGDIVASCNWYQKPQGGVRDALVHIVDGGLYPYAPDRGTRYPVTGRLLPPVALFPAAALSGLARCETAAFPEEMRGNLFSAQHNTRKVQRHVLKRVGSTYSAESVDFVWSENPDFHPSDVLEAPDGSLIVVDTGAWYVQHCPTGKIRNSRAPGGIYRVRWTGARPGGKRAEPARIPMGLSVELLQKWLPDPAAARALARLGKPEAEAALAEVLKAGDAPQKLGAAEALASCGSAASLEAIWNALEDDLDPFLEHALVHAAWRLANPKALESALSRKHPRVRKAALILLDQKTAIAADTVLAHAGAADPELRQAALGILRGHADWASSAVALVEAELKKATPTAEELATLRGLILAFQTDAAVQRSVGAAFGTHPIVLLETIAQTSLPALPAPWRDAIAASLGHAGWEIRLEAVRTVATLQLKEFDEPLGRIARRAEEPEALRLEALRALSSRGSLPFKFLLAQLGPAHDPATRLTSADILAKAGLDDSELSQVFQIIAEDRLISPSLFLPQLNRFAPARRDGRVVKLLASAIGGGWRPSRTELGPIFETLPADARERIEKSDAEQRARLTQFESLLKGGDAAKGREAFFGKKVACASCHSVGTQGGKVGPDLTKIGAIRAGRDLLESIVLPSSTFAQGYEPYLVRTQDGDVVSGVIARQSSDALVFRESSGKEIQVRRDRIQEMKRAEKSIMPEGLERAMSADEFRDLLAFLQSLK